jgi:hypothetical protein
MSGSWKGSGRINPDVNKPRIPGIYSLPFQALTFWDFTDKKKEIPDQPSQADEG